MYIYIYSVLYRGRINIYIYIYIYVYRSLYITCSYICHTFVGPCSDIVKPFSDIHIAFSWTSKWRSVQNEHHGTPLQLKHIVRLYLLNLTRFAVVPFQMKSRGHVWPHYAQIRHCLNSSVVALYRLCFSVIFFVSWCIIHDIM